MPALTRLSNIEAFSEAFSGPFTGSFDALASSASLFSLPLAAQGGATGALGSFEALERLATFASRAHALTCCPCGQDHSADLMAHKVSLAVDGPETGIRWVSENVQRAPEGTPERAIVMVPSEVGATPGTAVAISLGDSIFSQIELSADQDWFAIQLEAGVTYEFTLSGTGSDPLDDPFLELMNAAGVQVAQNDDGGGSLNSRLRYTPVTTDTFYLNAHGWADTSGVTSTGAYVLTAIEAPPLPTYTVSQIATYLVTEGSSSGRSWGPDSITYNVEALTPAQQLLAERALQVWSAVTPLTFTRVTSGGNITFTNIDPTPDGPAAYAQNTFSGNTITASTIVITSDWQSGETAYDSYTQQTYIHEVGHALGLGHAGPYNGTADFGTDNIYTNDNWANTVMSYFDQSEAGHGSYRFVLGLQQADIAAIQQLYGARPGGTYAGNTTFGFNSSAPGTNIDWAQFVLVQAEGTYRRPPSMTIYDTSGVDTINLSGFSQPQILDLRPGTFSSLGDRPNAGQPHYTNVVAIDASTTIENAVGGAGNDRITGNTANNTVTLGGGTDTFVYLTSGGADTITDFAVSVDRLDLTAFSSTAALAAFNGRTSSGGGTLLTFSAGQTILLQGVSTGQLSQSNLILSSSPPPGGATNAADDLQGTSGNDVLNGLGGNDILRGLAGDDRISGGDGLDLRSIGANIYRLYLGTLGREPDPPSFRALMSMHDSGQTTFGQMVAYIVTSPEFAARYGQTTNTQFVTLLYNNVLGRTPDTGGLNGWVNSLNAGMSRASLVTAFTDSPESVDRQQFPMQSFAMAQYHNDVEGQVFRLYQSALGRTPDAAGFTGWANYIQTDQATYNAVIGGFVESPEFQARYGNLNNTQFVTLLYANVLGRQPDPGGLEGWVNYLNGGASRFSVVAGFAESPENISNSRGAFLNFMRSADLGWQDTLYAGTGTDSLFGGRGADTFVLSTAETGSKTIYGLQAYDIVRLVGFSSVGQVTSALTQQGNDAVFTIGGLTVRFVAATVATVVSVLQVAASAEIGDGTAEGQSPEPVQGADYLVSETGNWDFDADAFDFSGLASEPGARGSLPSLALAADGFTSPVSLAMFDFSGLAGVDAPGAVTAGNSQVSPVSTGVIFDPLDFADAALIDLSADQFDFNHFNRPLDPDWA